MGWVAQGNGPNVIFACVPESGPILISATAEGGLANHGVAPGLAHRVTG